MELRPQKLHVDHALLADPGPLPEVGPGEDAVPNHIITAEMYNRLREQHMKLVKAIAPVIVQPGETP